MGAVLTDIQLANMALSKFGAGAIQTFADTTPAGSKTALIYRLTIDGLLSEYPWSFTKMTVPLARLDEQRDASGLLESGWRHAFELPAHSLCLPEKYLDNPRFADWPLRHFEIQNTVLYADVERVWAVGRFAADPAAWPPYFVQAAVACLAAELVMPISGNSGQLQSLQQIAWGTPQDNRNGGLLGVAKAADARSQGSKVIRSNPLIDARN